MGFARVQIAFTNDSNLPRDEAQNVWHFNTPSDVASAGPDIETVLSDFYDEAHSNILFSNLITGAIGIKVYDLEDAMPRPPVYEGSFSLTGTMGAPFPAEVAIAMTYQAPQQAGVNQQRRRGRIYLGPIATAASAGGTGDLRVSSSARTDIAQAASDLIAQTVLPGLVWSVYSPTIDATSTLSAAFATVTNGWIDDAFDIQRRRGLAPTTRTTYV